jgi:hypothetical protein
MATEMKDARLSVATIPMEQEFRLTSNRSVLEHHPEGQTMTRAMIDLIAEPHSFERITTTIEEILIDSNPRHAQNLFPSLGDNAFHLALRGNETR